MIQDSLGKKGRFVNPKSEYRNPKQIQNSKYRKFKCIGWEHSNFENSRLFRISCFEFRV